MRRRLIPLDFKGRRGRKGELNALGAGDDTDGSPGGDHFLAKSVSAQNSLVGMWLSTCTSF